MAVSVSHRGRGGTLSDITKVLFSFSEKSKLAHSIQEGLNHFAISVVFREMNCNWKMLVKWNFAIKDRIFISKEVLLFILL